MRSHLLFLGILTILLSACTAEAEITDFEGCAAAGNPVMESYPRQCRANGQTFVEEVEAPVM